MDYNQFITEYYNFKTYIRKKKNIPCVQVHLNFANASNTYITNFAKEWLKLYEEASLSHK